MTKSASPTTGTVGQNETYTLTVTNNSGTNSAANVVVTDALPAGLTFVSATSSVGTATQAGGIITGNLGTLAPGASATITITVTPTAVGSITNSAVVATSSGDTDLTNNTASTTTTINSAVTGVDLAVTKIHSTTGTIVPGQAVSYTITVTNNGSATADNVVLSEPLPAGLILVSDTASLGTVAVSGATLTNTIGSLAAGQSATLTIIAMPTATGTISNTATATTTSTDVNASNDSATDSITVASATSAATLTITKTPSPTSGTVGQNETYTITVNNTGSVDASNVVVSDVLPAGMTFVSATSSVGTTSNANGTITANLGTLAAGGSATITVVATPTTAGTFNNTAIVTTSSGVTNTANSTVSSSVVVTQPAIANVVITKIATPDPDLVGQNLTYTITVQNTGTADAANTVVTDSLPAGMTFVSATSSAGTTTQSGGTVTANLGTLAAGATDTITIIVSPTSPGTFTNSATVSTTSPNSNTNLTAAVSSTVNTSGGQGGGAGCFVAGQPGNGTDVTFINNMYHELLGRDADAGGMAFWQDFLNRDGNANHLNNPRRFQMIQFFMASQEYRDHLVNCMYEHFLNRGADAGGLQFFSTQLANGVDEEVVLSEIVGSQEYFVINGGTNLGFADALYRDILGRAPDSGGEAYWANRAATAGASRDQVVRDMLNSTEARHDLLINPTGSALSQLTGSGWENLYFQGNLGGAHDVFFDKLQGNTPWDDVIEDMLETDRYYDASKSI